MTFCYISFCITCILDCKQWEQQCKHPHSQINKKTAENGFIFLHTYLVLVDFFSAKIYFIFIFIGDNQS